MSSTAYAKSRINSVNRGRKRATYDRDLIHGIIDASPILHIAFNLSSDDNPFPVVLPMLGCTGSFHQTDSRGAGADDDDDDDDVHVYLHGYVSARVMRLAGSTENPLPITISAAILDGLVLALTPFNSSCNYRSAAVFGYATVVTEEKEKVWATELITENIIQGRWAASRTPPTKNEMTSTSILRVTIQTASAKVRAGGPDDDRKDLEDDELRAAVWTGVVPSWLHWGQPVPARENRVGGIPQYVTDWVDKQNADGRIKATEATRD